jgi:transcriptional regulator with XRE-family HTH domain
MRIICPVFCVDFLKDIAIESGVDAKTVSRFLNQKSKVDKTTEIAICQALGVNFEDVIDRQDTTIESDRIYSTRTTAFNCQFGLAKQSCIYTSRDCGRIAAGNYAPAREGTLETG